MARQQPLLVKPKDEPQARQRLLLHELKDRSLWFVRIRWWMPPAIWAGLVMARAVGVRMPIWPLLGVSLFILGYNAVFQRWHQRFVHEPALQTEDILRRFTRYQVMLDFLALFAFAHWTGGVSSPFLFFFIFHIIFASILLKHATAYLFAAAVALIMGLMALAESLGWLPHHSLTYRDRVPIELTGQALPGLVKWGFFAVTLLLSSYLTTHLMELIRRRIHRLAELSEAMLNYNNRLRALHVISQTIVTTRGLQAVLELVCRELAKVMLVQGTSVKLLTEDGRKLRYVTSHGLPARFAPGKEVEVDQSPLNRRIIEGEPFAAGHVTQNELFQLGEEFASAHVQSVLFVPLRHERRVIGILGAYSREPDRFRREDIDFLQLAAELVGIALENARAYEEIEELGRERQRFTLRVAHNLRAPLAAMVSLIDVLRGGFAGDLTPTQRDYLDRMERRARGLGHFIDELLQLAETQGLRRPAEAALVDMGELVLKVGDAFRERAAAKGLAFEVVVAPGLPRVLGVAGRLQNLVENLVSNAIKYTPAGGRVGVELALDAGGLLRLEVRDTGIGIPADAREKLFTEFFRAANARSLDETGTGLGLVIVKEIAEQHGGRIAIDSEEGRGSTFTIHLPGEKRESES